MSCSERYGRRGDGPLRRFRRSASVALLLLAATAAAQDSSWRGRSLDDLLWSLRERGLQIVYSSRLVPPELTIAGELPAGPAERVLAAALAEHGLRAERSADGRLVVVRAPEPERPPPPPDPEPAAVDVVVRDEIVVTPVHRVAVHVSLDGEPVRGLEAGRFEVEVAGRTQKVLGVEVAESASRRSFSLPGRAARGGDPGRLWILVLDASGGQGPWRRARQVAESLGAALGASDRLAVAVYAGGGLESVMVSGEDSASLAGALAEVSTGLGRERSLPELERHQRVGIGPDGVAVSPQLEGSLPTPEQLGGAAVSEHVQGAWQMRWQAVADDVSGLLRALEALVAETGEGLPRREVVIASEGFDAALLHGREGTDLEEIERIEALQRAVERGAYWRFDNDERFGHPEVVRRVEGTVDAYRRAGSAVHAVFTGSPDASGGNGLETVAGRTGGRWFASVEGFEEALPVEIAHASVTYWLSFRLDERSARKRRRDVRVEVAGLPRRARVDVRPLELPPP